jgi:hypothetical protein
MTYQLQRLFSEDPASYPMDNRISFPGVKRPGGEADHPPPSRAEVKNLSCCTPTPPIHLHGMVLSYNTVPFKMKYLMRLLECLAIGLKPSWSNPVD